MSELGRDTVVVEKERSSNPIGWIVGIVVALILLAVFFSYGGFGLFNGSNGQTTGGTVNVNTPKTVNVQPAGQ